MTVDFWGPFLMGVLSFLVVLLLGLILWSVLTGGGEE